LTGGSRTALPRQQTLRAMIDWSYSLLTEQEKTLFRRLAVFVGGWTLEAAESVCADEEQDGILPHDILDLLTRLVDKSLLTTEEVMGEARYHRLETIRQYSREKFFETNEVESIRNWHLSFFVRFASRWMKI
jgi:predicted ATPase